MPHLLEVKNLKTQFKIDGDIVQAVDGVSYYINEGEIVSVVGESGCGKSVSQFSVLQLIPTPPGKIVGGEVLFEGTDLLKFKANSSQIRDIRGGKMGVIFQEPMTSLNPALTIGQQIVETCMLHLKMSKSAARERAIKLIKMVGIPDSEQRINDYPHQLSGGMRQRVMIAMAMACRPKLLIADEATTALDVTTQAQLLDGLCNLAKETNTSLLFVTHNLGIVARYAERIYVMYAGRIVESGTAKDIFANPRHPYTIGLLKAVPRLDDPKDRKLVPIDGMPPNLINKPATCAFLPRCSFSTPKCSQQPAPELKLIEGQHYYACHVNIEERVAPNNSGLTDMDTASAAPEVSKNAGLKLMEKINLAPNTGDTLLEVRNLSMSFPVTGGIWRRKLGAVGAVDDVSFKIKRGETLGLVGESGCGKTTVARCILRLYQPTAGQIIFNGQDIAQVSPKDVRPIRRNLQLIFQDPYSSLNPRQSAGKIVGEPLIIHGLVKTADEYNHRVDELFTMVGLDPRVKNRVPHEFSGGQRQRIGIARALASNPQFIVCDEPISALDVSIQAQIINLLEELQQRLGLTYLFIAHDLSVVRHISDRVGVMYLGRLVEIADWQSLYENPLHPYTQALLAAVPIPDPFVEEQREHLTLKGEVPSLMKRPTGCNFHPRCPRASKECSEIVPELREVNDKHSVACIHI